MNEHNTILSETRIEYIRCKYRDMIENQITRRKRPENQRPTESIFQKASYVCFKYLRNFYPYMDAGNVSAYLTAAGCKYTKF